MIFMIVSIILISIIGTFSHFFYDMSKHNKVVGLFSAVNESTWEHIKIALTPTILWSVIDGFIYGTNTNYFLAKLVSLLVIVILMPSLFYGYKVLLKKELFILDIIIFYVVIISSQYLFYFLLRINPIDYVYIYLSCLLLFVLFGCYLLLTLMPLKNFLFKDPISNKYGFRGHTEIHKE